jgi:tripartite ATP-independent transporter DctM subunit
MSTLLILALLFLLLAIGLPVGFSMGLAGTIGLLQIGGWDMVRGILTTAPMSGVNSYDLIPIPMFLLMAEFVLLSGVADDLFAAAAAWIGRVRGGLGMATAAAGAGFGAICGTSTASAATLSSTTLPAMIKQGYEPQMAAGVVAISGTLAMLIPPTVVMIIFGLIANVSIPKLLIAGILPAVLVTITIMLTVYLLAVINPKAAPVSAATPWNEKFRLLAKTSPMLVLMALVTGSIYLGVATVTESAALGAIGGLAVAIYRGKLNRASFVQCLMRATHGTCMIMMIVIGASIFGYFFALTQITQDLVAWVGSLGISKWWVIFALLVGYLILGTFMDQMAIIFLTVPIVLPVIVSLGFDPIWFGVIKIVTAEVGLILPPIGLNCFVVARYSGLPVGEVFRGSFPHVIAHFVAIAILVAFPQISLWLPSHM